MCGFIYAAMQRNEATKRNAKRATKQAKEITRIATKRIEVIEANATKRIARCTTSAEINLITRDALRKIENVMHEVRDAQFNVRRTMQSRA